MYLPLPENQILRFKGRSAKEVCDLWAAALQGRCKRTGNTLTLMKEVQITVAGSNPPSPNGSGATGGEHLPIEASRERP